jgi:hypothetical protein
MVAYIAVTDMMRTGRVRAMFTETFIHTIDKQAINEEV